VVAAENDWRIQFCKIDFALPIARNAANHASYKYDPFYSFHDSILLRNRYKNSVEINPDRLIIRSLK
jgi:hypothetical protein